jgi:yersiniabactin nonribosomal peptide synthetase
MLDALPLTPNGKVDRKALPMPDEVRSERERTFVAPQTQLEASLAEIWTQVLNINRVGIHDNFFELGGDSLLAIQIISRVYGTFRVELSLQSLFNTSNIADLAKSIGIAMEEKMRDVDSLVSLPQIVPAPDQRYQPFPLTDIQHAYWIGRSGAYDLGNIAAHFYYEIESDHINIERLNLAWQRLIERHEMLRAVILPDGQQHIMEYVPPYQFEVIDLRGKGQEVVAAELEAIRQEMCQQILPADQWPLFEIRAARLDGQRIRVHIDFDNMIADAWSLFIFLREWAELYLNPDAPLSPLELSFRDYVLSEADLRNSDLYQRDQAYWVSRLSNLPPAPDLPLAKNPADLKQPAFVRRNFKLKPEIWLRLKNRASKAGLTPSGILIAVYAEVLSVWSKSPSFTINVTLFNRLPLHTQVNEIVGDFTSLNLLAVENSGAETFITCARNLQQQLWQDLDHRLFSGIQVMRELTRLQRTSQQAIMPVVFTSTLMGSVGQDASVLTQMGELVYGIFQTPQVWLDHQVYEQDGTLVLNWDAVEELFPDGLLDDMFDAYCHLLRRLADEEAAWQETTRQLIPAAQLERRAAANATEAPISSEMLHALFAAQVPDRLEQPAVISTGRTLTYEGGGDGKRLGAGGSCPWDSPIRGCLSSYRSRVTQRASLASFRGWRDQSGSYPVMVGGEA